jgi:hypothetical protein
MSQNVFGQPQPTEPPQQVAVTPEQDSGSRRRLLVLGGAGAVAIALCGAAVFLQTSGGDDAGTAGVDVPAAVAPAPVATPTADAESADTSVALPALAEFNGRNPFKSKTVDAVPASASGAGTVAAVTGGAGVTSSAGQAGTGTATSSVRVTFRGLDATTPAADDVVFDVEAGSEAVAVTVVPGQALGTAGPAASLTFVSVGSNGAAQVKKGDVKPYQLPLDTPVPLS